MSSKALNPGSELYGQKGDANLGRKAKWAGSEPGPDTIASVSKIDRVTQGAPRRAGNPPVVKRMDPKGVPVRAGYGGYRCG